MCGRFVQAQDLAEYAEYFGAAIVVSESVAPSWNVAPTSQIYAVAEHERQRRLGTFQWGLIPWFAKDQKMGARHINARAESVHAKPSFKRSFVNRRCLIPVDGFYEWERLEDGDKLPHYMFHRDGSPLALAGLWGSWGDEGDQRITSCTVITTTANKLVAPIHDRMPVILTEDVWDRWLDSGFGDVEALRSMLTSHDPGVMGEYPVSTLVNKVSNNFPECIEPLR